ncbi:MAG: hypothetical protein Q8Q32_02460 [bacterium]|nr:hypothetical protein [bacterium]
MKKIAVQKHDEASFVIEQVLDAKDDNLVLSLPKGSKFAQSGSNFSLLKKQADLLGKELKIESVDDDALGLATKAGLHASNPFFGRMEQRQFSDIIVNRAAPGKSKKAEKIEKTQAVHSVHVRDIDDGRSDEEEEEFIETLKEEMDDDIDDAQAAHIFHHHTDAAQEDDVEKAVAAASGMLADETRERVRHYRKSEKKFSFKKKIILALILLLLIFALYFALVKLPKAEIVLATNKEAWSFEDSIIASKNAASIDINKAIIPAELFSQKVNRSFQFKANGEEFIERKAVGKIVIYNAFNAEPQPLVATTRFETPDGKIFRTVSDVVVPGAKIESGKIVPSSIEVEIIADKAGEAYNLGPVAKLTVPGFEGTERFKGFYGEIPGASSSGFVGNAIVATEKDREAALKEARKAVESAAAAMLGSKIPEGFASLKDAGGFKIIKERVDDRADEGGMFSVFIEAEVYQLAFKEGDVNKLLQEMAVADLSEIYEVASDKVEFNRVIPNFEDGTLIMEISYEGMLRQKIDVNAFKQGIAGKKQDTLQGIVSALPGLSKADISLWPFWVSSVSKNLGRISVEVD